MREILLRGQTRRKGQMVRMDGTPVDSNWVEGYGVCMGKGDFSVIYAGNHVEKFLVYTDTVGQFTGLTDKNGKKIFEGDIFKMEDEIVAVIIFHEGCFRLQSWGMCGAFTESGYDECGGGWGIIECEPIDWYYIHDMEVIGNIHDNPELLEVEDG